MIKLYSLKRIVKFGFISFWRHWWLSFTSIFFMAITLIIVSLFIVLNFAIQTSTTTMKNKMDMEITFKVNAPEDQVQSLQHALSSRSDVRSVELIDKKAALVRWKNLKIKDSVKNLVTEDNNFLPESLEVKAIDPSSLDDINQYVAGKIYTPIIETTSYTKNKDTVQTFLNATTVVHKVGIAVSVIFFAIAIMIVLNTIRMAIFTRKDEIEIMRLIGASNHFIKVPFVVEGVLYGVVGCILSLLFLVFGSIWLSKLFSDYLQINLSLSGVFLNHLVVIGLLQLLLGVFIGVSSALISINRYLKI